ncbi:pimeloyl-ACP methyl ester carboxylesterase [Pseudonocardia parietis]|uniref:Pimeloyl-ACP methyl ester carboxylesterase n=1 Tax=Pseudonocardia parietis TaxID=570936 RepID=A0ABS4W801_9PSEU|nr:pimeloyl-ACP methyl ester carboxylesterase [Pseudonocardia parietis]
MARLSGQFDVVVPDLRGFGDSDKHRRDPVQFYGRDGQARSVAALAEELGISQLLVAGYDVGSRVAQHLARCRPDLVRAVVVTPPAPGVGPRIVEPKPLEEFWYQWFHQLDLAEELIDGDAKAARIYVRHFWSRWSGPGFYLDPSRLDHLASTYGRPGAFTASVAWYRAGGGSVISALTEAVPPAAERSTVPTTFLWPQHDPLFPMAWADRLDEFFTDVSVEPVNDAGHFVPVEMPDIFARAIRRAADGISELFPLGVSQRG